MKKKLLILSLLVGTLVVFSVQHGPPKKSTATPTTSYWLYGINGTSGDLVRYDFDEDALTTVGSITSDGTVLTGIQGAAYIPGHTNIIGFWNDPSDSQTKLAYINTGTAAASLVGSPLGAGTVTGATAVEPAGGGDHQVYAVQAVEGIDFDIDPGTITPDEDYVVRITSLGAAISYGGLYDEPVIVRITVDGTVFEPFGPWGLPLNADVNNDDNPRHVVIPGTWDADTVVSVSGRNWIKKLLQDGDRNSEWQIRREVHSDVDTNRVIVLRNGDAVPAISGFLNQGSIMDFVVDYVDTATNTMVLGETQAIYLFELGSSLTGAAADFQDLVVLVTVAREAGGLSGDFDPDTTRLDGTITLNPNSNPSSSFTLTKPDGTTITESDLTSSSSVNGDGVFYSGGAQHIEITPGGGGTQNGLTVDGAGYGLTNANTYTVTGLYLPVIIYNDSISGGNPVGNWIVRVYDGHGQIEQGTAPVVVGMPTDDVASVNLIRVNHQTGATETVMGLARAYDSLAALSDSMFLGTSSGQMYLINTSFGVETLVGTMPQASVGSLEYVGGNLVGYSSLNQSVFKLNSGSGAVIGSATAIGASDLGSLILREQSVQEFAGFD